MSQIVYDLEVKKVCSVQPEVVRKRVRALQAVCREECVSSRHAPDNTASAPSPKRSYMRGNCEPRDQLWQLTNVSKECGAFTRNPVSRKDF